MGNLIYSTNVKKAHLMDFFQVMQLISKWLDKEDLELLKLNNEALNFKVALKELDDALQQAKKTGFTQKIIEADNVRDNVLSGMGYIIKGMTYFPDKNLSDMAEQVKNIMAKYGKGVQRLTQREESAVIENILQDLQTEPIASMLPQLGLSQWVAKLQETNTNFDNLYLARSEKEAAFISGLSRKQRDEMQQQFEHLCKAIEAYAFIEGEEAYKPIADRINVEVAKIKQLAKTRKFNKDEDSVN